MAIKLGMTTLALGAVLAAAPSGAAAGVKCKTVKHRAKVESVVFKTDLAYINIRKRFCYDGKRVTSVSRKLQVEPSFKSVKNVRWSGLASPVKHRYQRWHGRRHGAHYSRAVGLFTSSTAWADGDETAEVAILVFGNGDVLKKPFNPFSR